MKSTGYISGQYYVRSIIKYTLLFAMNQVGNIFVLDIDQTLLYAEFGIIDPEYWQGYVTPILIPKISLILWEEPSTAIMVYLFGYKHSLGS